MAIDVGGCVGVSWVLRRPTRRVRGVRCHIQLQEREPGLIVYQPWSLLGSGGFQETWI